MGTIDNVTNSGNKNVEIAQRGRAETEQGMAKLDGSHGGAVRGSGTQLGVTGGAAGMRADHSGAGKGHDEPQATDRQSVPSQQQQFQSGASSGYSSKRQETHQSNNEQNAHSRVNGGGSIGGGFAGDQDAPSSQRQN